jgi:hypothetical protein
VSFETVLLYLILVILLAQPLTLNMAGFLVVKIREGCCSYNFQKRVMYLRNKRIVPTMPRYALEMHEKEHEASF